MFIKSKRKRHSNIAAIAVALLLVCTMTMTAFAEADLSGTIGVTGLTANSSSAKDWTASAGGAVWEGTTTSSGGCSPTYTATDGTLVFTNNSGSTQVLSFDYTLSLNGGSFTIAGASKTANGSFSQTLANGESVTLVAKTSGEAANTTKVTLSNIKLAVQSVNITFAAPTNGSYTMNGTAVTANTTVTNPSTTTYKLVATPAECYHFDGWYLGDTKVYETATVNTAAFATSGTVTARFKIDPLYNKATVPADCTMTKDQLVSINTYYLHDTTNKLVADGGFPGNNSAYSKTAASKTKDKIDVQYVPYSVWDDSMAINVSGTAMGDYVDGGGQESYAYARVISDVIRIYAKENCNITFDYAGSLTTGGSTATETNANAYTYTYVTTAANATVAQVKGGTQYTGSGTTPTIALSKGNYLYILTEGYARNRYLNIVGSSQFSMSYTYSASISNFTVELNVKKDILTAGFRDNTGKALGSGKISVNNVAQTIGTNGNMTDMSFADQAAVTLTVNTAPANYVHIGWEITPEGGTATRVYTPTYSRTLTENVTVNALFVPKTIITMGANGYSDASYTDVNGTALSGQYVARNAGCTEYYTSLADAFSKTDVVVLLAGSTINGDWTIPSGKTFVIPFGMNDAGSTTPVMGGGMGSWDYCQVNLNGNLNVAGTLLVSAQQNQSTGATGGNPGHLVVASGKTITVSGSLYAYGPVTGAGKVETTATAKIHETAEFSDNAPVMYVYNIYDKRSSYEVFPFNTMFINSIEIPVTYQLGATLTAHAAVRYDTTSTAAVPIIAGSGAMMNHTAGTITKFFDASAGQFVFRLNSGATAGTGSFSITLTVTVASRTMDITMDSADYYIPLAAPFRFEVAGNFTINDNYKALPGMIFDIQEGGTMTVASGSELILYRRNDYDYRGKHANSTEQWGYGERAYPINPQRFNGVSYPFSFSNSNMGSAKLNVDGTLIVNGGLYVTNEVQTDTANGLALTADGYNYLTGSGKIDMTNAATSLTEINEVMRAQGTNELKWDTVATVPLKGLKADATADEAAQYESLNGKTVTGSTNANGLNVWSADPCAAGHTLTPTAAAEATCVTDGHKAYWTCGTCGKSFSDEACTTEIPDLEAWLEDDTETGGKIPALGHDYTDVEVIYTWNENYTACEAARTCNVCGVEGGEPTEIVSTTNISEGVKTPATCSVMGWTTYTATFEAPEGAEEDIWVPDANSVDVENIAVDTENGHTYGEVTYTWTAYTACVATRACTVCPAETKGHTETANATIADEVTKVATCKETGVRTYTATFAENVTWATAQTKEETIASDETLHAWDNACDTDCNNGCGATQEATHSYDSVVTAPTCTGGGFTTHTCTICGDSYTDSETAAMGCSYSDEWKTDADNHWHACSVCGEESEKVAHADGNNDHKCDTCEYVMSECSFTVKGELQTAGTCMAEAVYKAHCSVCGAVSETETIKGEKGDHSYDDGVVTPPTCENGGFTTYTCQVEGCGHSYTDNETAASGHTYGTPVFSWNGYICTAKVVCNCNAEQSVDVEVTSKVTTTATCTGEGVRTYTATAVYNGTTYTSDECPTENLGIDSTNHVNKTEHGQTAATCTEIGYTAGTYCEDCKTWISGHEEIKALEHDWTVSYSWSNDGKSCTATRACGNDAAHNETEIVTAADAVKTAATCLEKGTTTYTANFVADWAETQTRDMQDIAQLEHSYTGAIKSNGNGKDATHSFMCVNGCNEYGGAVTHTWNEGEQTKAPACEVAGVKTYTCTAEGCGATYTEEVAALVHTDADNDGDHKCDHGGCSEIISDCTDTNTDHKCDECDAELSKCTDGDDADHNCDYCGEGGITPHTYGKVTYTGDGKTSYIAEQLCACGDKQTATATITSKETKVATCTEEGETTYTADFTETWAEDKTTTEPIEKLDHNYVEKVENQYLKSGATCTAKALYYKSCSTCGEAHETEIFESGNLAAHSWVEATCTAPKTCSVCGATEGIALGHTWIDATYDAPKTCSVCGTTEGNALTRPDVSIEIPKAENVTVTPAEGETMTDEQKQEVINDLLPENLVQPVEPGFDDEKNKEVINESKDKIKDKDNNTVNADSYDTSLVITMKAVVIGGKGGAQKVTYDVTPWLYALSENGTVLGKRELNEFVSELSFHLPVDKDTKGTHVKVWHEDESKGLYEIQTDKNGNKYVIVTSKNFSDFTVEDHTHSYGTPAYDWVEVDGGYQVTATAICNCGTDESGKVVTDTVTETVTATYEDANGVRIHTATFTDSLFETQTKEVKIEVETLPTVDVANPANGTTISQGIVSAPDGGWTLTLTAADEANTYVYLVKYTDADGNVSEKIVNAGGKYNGESGFAIPADAVGVMVKSALAGDANLDGKINAKDVGQARQHVAKIITLDGLAFVAADVNQDGKVNAKDVGLLRQYIAKVITKF